MPYVKAEDVLPADLLKEIQKYVHGSLIYVPRAGDGKAEWGDKSGAREHFDRRNAAIREAKRAGATIRELAGEYHLSEDGIRKVLYGMPKSRAS
jgi:Mor family transcriptional regulator